MQRAILKLLLISVTFACLSLQAKDVTSAWFADGKFIEESDSQRMTNGFGGRLDFTSDPDFLQNWRSNWNSVSTIKHLDGVYIVVFVACKYDVEDQDAVYDLTIKGPNGSVYATFTNQLAVKQHVSLANGASDVKPTLRLGPRFTVLQIDPPDPVGFYTVEVELQDRLHNLRLKLQKKLNVTK